MNATPLAYRREQAAAAMGVSVRTFDQWLAEPDPPPSVKRGNCRLFPAKELRNWLSSQVKSNERGEE